MIPHYQDSWLTVYHGDSRAVMADMPPESVHCVVTSPPYWGLRDYGTATWLGGDDDHEHVGETLRTADDGGPKQQTKRGSIGVRSGDCRCGAIRQDGQLGLEPTPEAYVANMVDVFREVRRVLRSDGTVWLNLGDSYAAGPMTAAERDGQRSGGTLNGRYGNADNVATAQRRSPVPYGLKPKDLVGIPWRVAFALQADGWYLRSDIIWSKPNPMPESVTDRPTKSHEYLFLLSKSPRYYFDADAVREDAEPSTLERNAYKRTGYVKEAYGQPFINHLNPATTEQWNGTGRNIRSVWTIATAPYPGAHFATFPPKLVEPCIKAGTSERGVCPECGAPWVRVVERTAYGSWKQDGRGDAFVADQDAGLRGDDYYANYVPPRTTGWRPSCDRYGHLIHTGSDGRVLAPIPATVLDPFAGSGTTGMVAQSLSRRAVLIDLSMDYLEQLMERNREVPLGL